MSKIKILIIEDDHSLSESLKEDLIELNYEVVGIAENLKDAFGLFYSTDPDIIITDIMLEGQTDGIAFVEKIKENPAENKPIIFLTGLRETAVFQRAKKTLPASYLLKPFNLLELQYALELCVEKFIGLGNSFSANIPSALPLEDSFFVKKGNNLEKLFFNEIYYIKVEGKYCDMNTTKGKFAIQYALKELHQKLPDVFYQCHRNYLVNVDHIMKFDLRDNDLLMTNNDLVQVSKRSREKLLELMNRI